MIKVYTGTMASGKSSKLISDIKLAKQNNISILVLASNAGFREQKIISSRDGGKVSAIGIDTFKDVVTLLESEEYKGRISKVFLDEAQFLPNDLGYMIDMVNYLILNHINLTVSGLDLNCFGAPFPVMSNLFSYADEVVKFKGYCDNCKEESHRVIRYSKGEVDRSINNVLVVDSGSKLKYSSLCPTCFIKAFYN